MSSFPQLANQGRCKRTKAHEFNHSQIIWQTLSIMPRLLIVPLLIFSLVLFIFSRTLWQLRQAPPPAPWLAFASDRTGDWEIYRMRVNGSELQRLTFNYGRDDWPLWSPDGNWIAFRSIRFGDQQIYRIRPDGTQTAQLTALPLVGPPSWSPDSQWITFPSLQNQQDGVYRIRADGTDLMWLTVEPHGIFSYGWLPGGGWLLAQSIFRENEEIFRLHVSGGRPINLTQDPGNDGLAVGSPDGKWIAFVSDRAGSSSLYVMQPDGTRVRHLHEIVNRPPLWSPDSEWIFFLWAEGDATSFYRIQRDGSGLQRIGAAAGDESFMTISPDGRWIAFLRRRDGLDNLYLLNTQNGHISQLTTQAGNTLSPSWGPLVESRWSGDWIVTGAGLGTLLSWLALWGGQVMTRPRRTPASRQPSTRPAAR